MSKGRYINVEPTALNFKALWQRLHDLDDGITAANLTIQQQQALIASLQSGLTSTSRNATQALISADVGALRKLIQEILDEQADGGGGGGGNFCTTQPLSTALPGWLYAALVAAGQTNNCWTAGMESSLEATFNANDFTIVSGVACSVRGRIFHQGNHGMWTTCNGRPDAQYVADMIVDVVVTNADGSVSWGWVLR